MLNELVPLSNRLEYKLIEKEIHKEYYVQFTGLNKTNLQIKELSPLWEDGISAG